MAKLLFTTKKKVENNPTLSFINPETTGKSYGQLATIEPKIKSTNQINQNKKDEITRKLLFPSLYTKQDKKPNLIERIKNSPASNIASLAINTIRQNIKNAPQTRQTPTTNLDLSINNITNKVSKFVASNTALVKIPQVRDYFNIPDEKASEFGKPYKEFKNAMSKEPSKWSDQDKKAIETMLSGIIFSTVSPTRFTGKALTEAEKRAAIEMGTLKNATPESTMAIQRASQKLIPKYGVDKVKQIINSNPQEAIQSAKSVNSFISYIDNKVKSDVNNKINTSITSPIKPKTAITEVLPKTKQVKKTEYKGTLLPIKVRGETFELVGVPKRKGYLPATRIRKETAKIIKERKLAEQKNNILKAKEETKSKIETKIAEQKAKAEEKLRIRKELQEINQAIQKGFEVERNKIRKQIGFERLTKELPSSVSSRVNKVVGITENKNATKPQLDKKLEILKSLEKGDTFLTENQINGLGDYLKSFDKDPQLVTKREIQERFQDQKEIFDGFFTKRIANEIFPTVDVKEQSQVIRQVVDKADMELRIADNEIKKVNDDINNLLVKAEKVKNKYQVGKDIFRKMGGENIAITPEEQDVVNYLRSYFDKARKELKLEKYRKNYITHTEKDFLEKLRTNNFNLIKTIQSYATKDNNLPIDIMLNLDEIIGSEKFFKFALERKGIIDPSTNIRKIVKDYSTILENKKALDKILPEGQASVQLLLQPKSAKWLKSYLQNLKGRALDYQFRNGKMGWITNISDKIVDFGYLRLLGLNYMSAIKNIIGGEVNSFVFQTFNKYLTGKYRLLTKPIKSYKIISQSGLLDGSYVDIARATFISKAKREVDLALYGGMEAAEYEIRGSMFLGELTQEEFKTGNITPKRFREILDSIAITQGIYTKIDSPLFVQTRLGRAALQFGRWKITNATLVRRITKGAKAEWKTGNFSGKNTRSLLKIIVLYGILSYLAYEAGKAGSKELKKIYKSGTELVDTIINLPQEVIDSITDNPSIQNINQLLFSVYTLLSYTGLTDKPQKIRFSSGIENTYFSAIKTLGLENKKSNINISKSTKKSLPKSTKKSSSKRLLFR